MSMQVGRWKSAERNLAPYSGIDEHQTCQALSECVPLLTLAKVHIKLARTQ